MMRDTPYAKELCRGSKRWDDASEARIERLRIKQSGQEEIRFSWWKAGRMTPRPLDLPEADLLALFEDALAQGVFTEDFRTKLAALCRAEGASR
jgi:hypothetical protein